MAGWYETLARYTRPLPTPTHVRLLLSLIRVGWVMPLDTGPLQIEGVCGWTGWELLGMRILPPHFLTRPSSDTGSMRWLEVCWLNQPFSILV